MKTRHITLFGVLMAIMLLVIGCTVDQPIVSPPETVETGSADFSTVVAIGNSLTAGVQDGCWLGSHAYNSYPALVADQMGKNVGIDGNADFVFPYISEPGAGTFLELAGFDQSGNPIINRTNVAALPSNDAYPEAFNNLAVPGALAIDALQAVDQASSAGGSNPLFNFVLRNGSSPNFGGTQLEQAIQKDATFVILWIGANDVLGAATSGNTTPGLPTPVAAFSQIYTTLMDNLTQALPGVGGVVANIPDVSSIPYVTTVSSTVTIPGTGTVPLFIQKGDGSVAAAGAADRILLPASSVIGDASGNYGPAGVPLGFSQMAPLPNSLVLDAAELEDIADAVAGYNQIIAEQAAEKGFALVDANDIFKKFASPEGVDIGGITFSSTFITGGLISLDGVHPNSLGYAFTANAFIEAINVRYGSNISYVNLREYIAKVR